MCMASGRDMRASLSLPPASDAEPPGGQTLMVGSWPAATTTMPRDRPVRPTFHREVDEHDHDTS